jgi:hypothetical protein
MRENRTSGLMRGGNGNGDSRPLLSTLLSNLPFYFLLSQRSLRSPRFILTESRRHPFIPSGKLDLAICQYTR